MFKKRVYFEKKFCPRQRSCPGQVASSKKSSSGKKFCPRQRSCPGQVACSKENRISGKKFCPQQVVRSRESEQPLRPRARSAFWGVRGAKPPEKAGGCGGAQPPRLPRLQIRAKIIVKLPINRPGGRYVMFGVDAGIIFGNAILAVYGFTKEIAI